MRISDWSSDVCSSDLRLVRRRDHEPEGNGMNAANQDGRRRSRVDAKVVELAAYRAGPGEPYVRVGTQRSEERRVGKEWVRVDHGGRRHIKKKRHTQNIPNIKDHKTTNCKTNKS